MNMRWAWMLPVLSSLTWAWAAAPALAQVNFAAQPGSSVGGPLAAATAYPAGLASPQPTQIYAQPTGYPQMPMMAPGMYPPACGYPSPSAGQMPLAMQPAAYTNYPMPAGPPGMMPGALPAGQGSGGQGPDVYGSYGYMPADYGGGQGYGPPGYGGQGYAPAGYEGQGFGGPGMGGPGMGGQGFGGPGMGGPGFGGQGFGGPSPDGEYGGGVGGPMGPDGACPYCGGQGCENCQGGMHGGLLGHGWQPGGLLGEVLGIFGPYPDGGCAAVRWFDVAVDYMALKRDNTGRNVNIASQGIAGPIVLSTNDLSFANYEPGFRVTLAHQMGPAGGVEFTYFGQNNWDSTATVTASGANNLFSVISQFGTVPLGIGFQETDQSDFQQISYHSKIDSFEANWRQRWMGPNCRYQGSWLLGVRHFILNEQFQYLTQSSTNATNGIPARANFNTNASNDLTGFQFGGDLWLCIIPGLRIGGELQAGVYGNHIDVLNGVFVNTPVAGGMPFHERVKKDDVSFIGQANLLATYRINYNWTARVGYTFLYLDGVGLATENFNTAPPALFLNGSPRTPFVNSNGNVFYHGYTAGLEFLW